MTKSTLTARFGPLRTEFVDAKKVVLRLLDAKGAVLMVAVRRAGEKDAALEDRLWADAEKRYAKEGK